MDKPQLFLLHFAGGNCYSFQFMMPFLKKFEVTPVELPGRGKRMKETLIRDFDRAAEDIYHQIMEKLTASRFVIYGHSMGATLGLRVASMLERNDCPPDYLIVSGNSGPGLKEGEVKRYLMESHRFMEELKRLGGMPEEILQNPELLEFFEPVLRADFEALEKEELDDEPFINIPIYAVMGSKEKDVAFIENWANYTRNQFSYRVLDGDHFFIYDHPQKMAQLIEASYDNLAHL